jgi:hypothetical protein
MRPVASVRLRTSGLPAPRQVRARGSVAALARRARNTRPPRDVEAETTMIDPKLFLMLSFGTLLVLNGLFGGRFSG